MVVLSLDRGVWSLLSPQPEMDSLLPGTPFESPFDRLTVPSKVEGLTTLSLFEILKAPSEIEGGNRRGGPPYEDP